MSAQGSGGEHRISQVYTRIGDKGSTQLVGGRTVRKDDPRLRAYGACDELQVALGAARDALAALTTRNEVTPAILLIARHLGWLQNRLFTLDGELATRVEDRWADMPTVGPEDVQFMEQLIDGFNRIMPPLKDFVLVGGHPAVTALHQCRVVCRRAEREIAALAVGEAIPEPVIPFVNRLSDLLFVLARRTQHELAGLGLAPAELIWDRNYERPPLPE